MTPSFFPYPLLVTPGELIVAVGLDMLPRCSLIYAHYLLTTLYMTLLQVVDRYSTTSLVTFRVCTLHRAERFTNFSFERLLLKDF